MGTQGQQPRSIPLCPPLWQLTSVTSRKREPRKGGAGRLGQDGPWRSSLSPGRKQNQPDQNRGQSWGEGKES